MTLVSQQPTMRGILKFLTWLVIHETQTQPEVALSTRLSCGALRSRGSHLVSKRNVTVDVVQHH